MTEELLLDSGSEPRDALDEQREFAEARAGGLFSTDGAKILLLSRWGTPRSVYNDKVGLTPVRPMSLPAWLGLRLQQTVSELFATQTGLRLRADRRLYWAKGTDFPMGAHLDFRVLGDRGTIVEAKTRARMTGWGPEGSTEIPPDVWVQVQHQMRVTGARQVHVAVLFGHHTFRSYLIPRDDEFLARYVEQLGTYWWTYVIPRMAPPYTGKGVDTDAVATEHPVHSDLIRPATPEQEKMVAQLLLARQNSAQVGEALVGWQNRVKDVIGDDAGIRGSFGEVTWKKIKDHDEVNWEQVAESYRAALDDLLDIANPGDDDRTVMRLGAIQLLRETAVGLFTTHVPGYRRFNVKEKSA